MSKTIRWKYIVYVSIEKGSIYDTNQVSPWNKVHHEESKSKI